MEKPNKQNNKNLNVELQNKLKDKNNYYIFIGALILFGISFYLIYFSKPSLVLRNYRNLPEAISPQSGKNMPLKSFQLYSNPKNDCFKFPESNVYVLKRDLRGFFVDNNSDFVNGYFRILYTLKMLESIGKDIPDYLAITKDYISKIDSIYAPAIFQYLFCMDEFGKMKMFLPDVIYEKNINILKDSYDKKYNNEVHSYYKIEVVKDVIKLISKELIQLNSNQLRMIKDYIHYDIEEKINTAISNFEKNYSVKYNKEKNKFTLFKERFPFLYNEKYKKEKADEILKESEILISNKGNYEYIIHFLLFHPKVISCDYEYILSNLCCGRNITLESKGHYFDWNFMIPKYWDLIVPKGDDQILMMFHSKLDGVSGGIGHYESFGSDLASETALLDSISKNYNYLNDILKISNLKILNKPEIKLLNEKKVIVIDYKGNKNNVFVNGKIYLFLTKDSVFAYIFNIEGQSDDACTSKMLNNTPLFDGLVKASKITYKNN